MTDENAHSEQLLRVEGLTVRVRETGAELIKDVRLQVRRGEIVCIVGESGSGKSVSARSIMGLTQLDKGIVVEGELWFNGRPVHERNAAATARLRGRELAMVFQEPMSSLDPLFTVESQLLESLVRRHGKLRPADAHTRMMSLLSDVGIHDGERVLRSYPHELSGGMCQRVMIAAALACEPELLIADEPTTALDVTVQAQILELLVRLRDERGMALLLVTHDMGVAAEVADRVIVMYSGRIVEDASPQDAFFDARHPYTAGLLECVPALNAPQTGKFATIPGIVPDPSARPAGCAFNPRCPRALDHCRSDVPPLEITSGRAFACWNPLGKSTLAPAAEGAR